MSKWVFRICCVVCRIINKSMEVSLSMFLPETQHNEAGVGYCWNPRRRRSIKSGNDHRHYISIYLSIFQEKPTEIDLQQRVHELEKIRWGRISKWGWNEIKLWKNIPILLPRCDRWLIKRNNISLWHEIVGNDVDLWFDVDLTKFRWKKSVRLTKSRKRNNWWWIILCEIAELIVRKIKWEGKKERKREWDRARSETNTNTCQFFILLRISRCLSLYIIQEFINKRNIFLCIMFLNFIRYSVCVRLVRDGCTYPGRNRYSEGILGCILPPPKWVVDIHMFTEECVQSFCFK